MFLNKFQGSDFKNWIIRLTELIIRKWNRKQQL